MERRSKYNAHPTEVDGIRFASQAEARRYDELKLMEYAGEIRELRVHPAYPIEINGERVCQYVADFDYLTRDGRLTVEDVKGVRTEAYRLKRKLMKAVHGIDVREVRA